VERIASIFNIEKIRESGKKCEQVAANSLQPPAQVGSTFADFSILKEAIPSSETSVHTRSTRRHIPEVTAMKTSNLTNQKKFMQPLLNAS
jgi:hypothetical protein